MIIIQIIYWVLFMYGILSLIQDIVTEFTYKRYNKNFRVYICITDFENEFENFEREISKIKWQFKNININVVNMDEGVRESELNNFFGDESIRVLSKEEFCQIVNNS